MNSTLLDQLFQPVTDCLTESAARKLLALRADPDLQTRLDELADKANRGTLSDTERAEYDSYLSAFHLVTVLQAQARKLLDSLAA